MQVRCAWCDRSLRAGPDHEVSHGICLECYPKAAGEPVERVASMTDEALEALPYGVVQLDQKGYVLAYTHREAALARREPAQVLGKHFFREVAPCTNVTELAGWFEEVQGGGLACRKRLTFVFAFDFGRQLVNLVLLHDPGEGKNTLLIEAVAEERSMPAVNPAPVG